MIADAYAHTDRVVPTRDACGCAPAMQAALRPHKHQSQAAQEGEQRAAAPQLSPQLSPQRACAGVAAAPAALCTADDLKAAAAAAAFPAAATAFPAAAAAAGGLE